MALPGFFKPKQSLSELEEDTEQLQAEDAKIGVELNIARKRRMISELKKRGLKPSHFGVPIDWRRIWQWLRTH